MSANSEAGSAVVSLEDKLRLAKEATRHLLNAICDDPRKYWLMGNGTGSWEKLTAAHAALWDHDVEEIRKTFAPSEADYRRYREDLDADRKLIEYCRENEISVKGAS